MSWSYDPALLLDSKKDQVRFKLGDTNPDSPVLEDEEIDFLLVQSGDDVLRATISACDGIISKISSIPDFRIGPYSESQGNRLSAYRSLRATLTAQLARLNAPIAHSPSTDQIFHYDMMVSGGCEHD